MKQVHTELLLCLLLAAGVTGQMGSGSMFGQQFGMGPLGMVSIPSSSPYGLYGLQQTAGLYGGGSPYNVDSIYGRSSSYVGTPSSYGGGSLYTASPPLYDSSSPYTASPPSYGGGSSVSPNSPSNGGGSSLTPSPPSYGSDLPNAPTPASYGSDLPNTPSPQSYGSGSSYGGGSSYGNNKYGSSYAEPTGPPYGIQSTGEYKVYYPEKIDISKCGPAPTKTPCTPYGPQYFPLPGYPQCYIQCAFERFFVKPCPTNLVWNTRNNACDWPTVAYGATSYGSSGASSGSSSSYRNTQSGYEGASSSSYGRKKRSTTERKKRGYGGYGGGSTSRSRSSSGGSEGSSSGSASRSRGSSGRSGGYGGSSGGSSGGSEDFGGGSGGSVSRSSGSSSRSGGGYGGYSGGYGGSSGGSEDFGGGSGGSVSRSSGSSSRSGGGYGGYGGGYGGFSSGSEDSNSGSGGSASRSSGSSSRSGGGYGSYGGGYGGFSGGSEDSNSGSGGSASRSSGSSSRSGGSFGGYGGGYGGTGGGYSGRGGMGGYGGGYSKQKHRGHFPTLPFPSHPFAPPPFPPLPIRSLPIRPLPIGLPLVPFALPGPVSFPGLVGLPGIPSPIGFPPPTQSPLVRIASPVPSPVAPAPDVPRPIVPAPIPPPTLPPPITPPAVHFTPPVPIPLSVTLVPGPAYPFGPPFGGPFGGPNIPPFEGVRGSFGGQNMPSFQSVSGSFGSENMPSFEGVSGSFGSQNMPSFQSVSGSFSSQNMPSFEGVSGSFGSQNMPSFEGVSGSFGSQNMPTFQSVSESFGGQNMPTFQSVSESFGGQNMPSFQSVSGGFGGQNMLPFQGVGGSFGGQNMPAFQGFGGGFGRSFGSDEPDRGGEFGGRSDLDFDFGGGSYGNDNYGRAYDDFNFYVKPYGNSYARDYDNHDKKDDGNWYSNYDDDDIYSGKSDYQRNGGFKSSGGKSRHGANSDDENYSDNYNDKSSYRKKRDYLYDSTNVQVPTVSGVEQEHLLTPLAKQQQQYQASFNPMQVSSYRSVQPEQPRLISTEVIPQPLAQSSPCVGVPPKSNIAHPSDASKYITCLTGKKYEVMDCPDGLLYNAASDQCKKLRNTEEICERDQPCMNDGQCHQTSPTTYACTCRGAWTGKRCETPLSSCASDPCGQGNECQTLKTNDYKQDFVCVCDDRQSYGLTCGRNTVPNPCLAASIEQEQYYPFAFSAQAFVQCNGDILYLQPCASGLYWNQESKVCDHIETAPASPAKDQSQSYQVTYATGQRQQPTYTRLISKHQPQSYQVVYGNEQKQQQQSAYTGPTASFSNQNIPKQQTETYQPQRNTDVQSSSINQVFPPNQARFYQSFQIPSRKVQQQPKVNFMPTQEQPVMNSPSSWSLPYGQSMSVGTAKQPQVSSAPQSAPVTFMYDQPASFSQLPKARTFSRVFQPELMKNRNTQSTSSGYRR